MQIIDIPQKPILQALACAVICLVGYLLAKLASNSIAIDRSLYWVLSGTNLLLFTVLNTMYGVRTDNIKQYWLQSIYSFLALLLFSYYSATFFSGLRMSESKSFGKIYIVLVFCHLLFFSISMIIRRLWSFFETENKNKLKKDGLL